MTTHKADEERASMMMPSGTSLEDLAKAIERAGWGAVAQIAEDRGDPVTAKQARELSITSQPECLADDVEALAHLVSEETIYLTGVERDSDEAAIFVTVADVKRARAALAAMPLASRGVDQEAVADFDALHKDYGRAARLITVMREKWQAVSDALDDIPGGMHADLEDAASAMASVCDDPRAALAQPLPTVSGDEVSSFNLVWKAAPRPPVHPDWMTGRQSFRTMEGAVKHFIGCAPDSVFVSLHETRSRTIDRSADALARLPTPPADGDEV